MYGEPLQSRHWGNNSKDVLKIAFKSAVKGNPARRPQTKCGTPFVSFVYFKNSNIFTVEFIVLSVARPLGEIFLVFLADRTNGRAIGTVLRPSVVVVCIRNVLWLNGAS